MISPTRLTTHNYFFSPFSQSTHADGTTSIFHAGETFAVAVRSSHAPYPHVRAIAIHVYAHETTHRRDERLGNVACLLLASACAKTGVFWVWFFIISIMSTRIRIERFRIASKKAVAKKQKSIASMANAKRKGVVEPVEDISCVVEGKRIIDLRESSKN